MTTGYTEVYRTIGYESTAGPFQHDSSQPAWVYNTFGVVETTCFIVGTLGSAIILAYFISTCTKSAITFLYIWISFLDLIICLFTLASAVSDFNQGQPMFFANTFFCNMSGFLSGISTNMSIFILAVLSVVGAVSVSFRECKIKRFHVAIPVTIYLLLLVIEYSLPFLFRTVKTISSIKKYGGISGYFYHEAFTSCTLSINGLFEWHSVPFWVLYFWVTFVNFLIPLPLVFVSSCVTIHQLRRGKSELQTDEEWKVKRDSALTIISLSGIYIALDLDILPCVIWMIASPWLTGNWNGTRTMMNMLGENFASFAKFVLFNSIGFNCLCNVLVFFCRIQGLRDMVRGVFRRG